MSLRWTSTTTFRSDDKTNPAEAGFFYCIFIAVICVPLVAIDGEVIDPDPSVNLMAIFCPAGTPENLYNTYTDAKSEGTDQYWTVKDDEPLRNSACTTFFA